MLGFNDYGKHCFRKYAEFVAYKSGLRFHKRKLHFGFLCLSFLICEKEIIIL